MSHFFILWDDASENRRSIGAAVCNDLADFPELHPRACEYRDALIVHALMKHAPCDQHQDEDGLACLWGAARDAQGDKVTARQLHVLWNGDLPLVLAGFHAGVRITPDLIEVGSDCSGAWPIWWWQCGGSFMASTSPHLFRHHPHFRARLNAAGLAQILLCNSSAGDQTIWQDVTRLGMGKLLRCERRRGTLSVREVRQNATPHTSACLRDLQPTTEPGDMSFTEGANFLDRVVGWSLQRALQDVDEVALIASGGRDSRILSGHLRALEKRARMFSYGLEDDYDVQCARLLARVLGCPWLRLPDREALVPNEPQLNAAWECLAAGFHRLGAPNTYSEHLPESHARFAVTGIAFDGCLLKADTARQVVGARSRDVVRLVSNAFWGASDDEISSLLPEDLARQCRDTLVAHQEAELEEAGGVNPLSQALYLQRATRIRFHLGSLLWGMSFRIWPISPVFDPAWSELTLAITPSVYFGRASQDWLLANRYPDLARVPMCHDMTFPRPLLKRPFWHRLSQPRGGVRRQKSWRYERLYDINKPAWREARRAAEDWRNRLPNWINRQSFDRILAGPDDSVRHGGDVFKGMSLARNLLGFLYLLDSPLGRKEA